MTGRDATAAMAALPLYDKAEFLTKVFSGPGWELVKAEAPARFRQ
jgi:hypothetical protein